MRAGFAGIGAAFLVGVVAHGIVLELWFLRIIVTDGPAPRYDVLLLPPWLVGAYVAARLGGLRAIGVVALCAVASLAVSLFREFTGPGHVDLGGIVGMAAWVVLGLVLGAVLARLIPAAIPVRRGLAAVSIFALGTLVLSLIFMVYIDLWLANLFNAVGWIAEGALAGIVVVRLGGRSQEALGLGGVVALGYLPAPLHQAGMAFRDGLLNGLAFTAPLLGMLTFVVVAFVLDARRTFPPRAATARPSLIGGLPASESSRRRWK